MARINALNLGNIPWLKANRTHEGAPARQVSPELQLRRSVLACMLWEDQFYEDGVAIAGRIRELVARVPAEKVAALAVEAHMQMKLRHAPLLLVREMARLATHRHLVAETLTRVIQRADELSEFVALYWSEGKQPLSAQVKKGLAAAFTRFDEYALAKYNRATPVKLRDVLFLSHAKPLDQAQADLWKRLVDGELATPDTWEVALSAGGDKRHAWERLLSENRLGALALLRNLRNMAEAKVSEQAVRDGLERMKTERVLPFRFIAAARYAPQWEAELEHAMFRALEGQPRLSGKTVLLVDVSGSMDAPLSRRSEMRRNDAGYGLAVLLREI
ncbi:MAG TPA: TROVE domain-containing protein, partial [Candidatus Limnocylindrales bacterium]|nr:TROVE domain-containing protein [Candidatus Limnocylindrales bacterium]